LQTLPGFRGNADADRDMGRDFQFIAKVYLCSVFGTTVMQLSGWRVLFSKQSVQ
jgi:hypothetical protein